MRLRDDAVAVDWLGWSRAIPYTDIVAVRIKDLKNIPDKETTGGVATVMLETACGGVIKLAEFKEGRSPSTVPSARRGGVAARRPEPTLAEAQNPRSRSIARRSRLVGRPAPDGRSGGAAQRGRGGSGGVRSS